MNKLHPDDLSLLTVLPVGGIRGKVICLKCTLHYHYYTFTISDDHIFFLIITFWSLIFQFYRVRVKDVRLSALVVVRLSVSHLVMSCMSCQSLILDFQ